jgi:hypothetical protein
VTNVPYPFQSQMAKVEQRNCLKSLASSVTKALEAHEVGTEGLFRCGMPAISTLETLLGDFLDSFLTEFSEVRVTARRPSWWRKMFVGSDEL